VSLRIFSKTGGKMNYKLTVLIPVISLLLFSCGKRAEKPETKKEELAVTKVESDIIKDYENIEVVKKQSAKFVPVDIMYDSSVLKDNEKKALQLIVKAAQCMDKIFLSQVYSKNAVILKALKENGNPDYKVLKKFFKINFGPFDRLLDHEPFINLAEKKPDGANFYPEDITKEEFKKWLKDHPEDEANFTSSFFVIRRDEGKLTAIPYSQFYKDLLEKAAKLLKEAAGLLENPSLKKYLNSRADAFLSNDYYQSDMDWMDLKGHKIEMVIGPYEVYEDKLFGYKAAFEAFITLVDLEESKKLKVLSGYVAEMEKNLPFDDKYKNFKRGESSPVMVVNEVFTGGDTKAGVQTIAFNLPNDERVREAKGCKKVMLKNICRAKFDKIWIPIAQKVLAEEEMSLASFDSYFNHILMHEFSHGLGPGNIVKEGKKTTVNKELQELYSVIEEAKADILGIWNLKFMIDKGVFPKELAKSMYATYLGGIFRSIRFGIGEAHGGGNAIQINYILEKGGFIFDEESGRFSVNREKIEDVIKQLAVDILMLQVEGDYAKAKAMIEKYVVISPPLQRAIDAVADVPVDIKPIYAIEKE
jgi:hypothetical protein